MARHSSPPCTRATTRRTTSGQERSSCCRQMTSRVPSMLTLTGRPTPRASAPPTSFLIADGISPSNEFRGYVLRRLIRRAAMHGRRLGLKTGSLSQLGGEVVKTMQRHYHELTSARDRITQVILEEEEKFERTLAQGLTMINEAIARATAQGQEWTDADNAVRLSDTSGSPLAIPKARA